MSTLSLRLPDSVHEQIKQLAKKDGISINQFAASAIAEKMAAYLTEEYLKKRAANGNEQAFLSAMDKVPATEPAVEDKLP
ncbi:toxin-antitoxin system HicB family antitoxin [Cellvibrio sp. pealriver]|uniref:toxin-antitoxin system HicB family antitoxin n=1 Tax=Cellvibrio sp. pealriver TaxID=1622269 RepID=UPI00066FE9A7|nr:toxin-antitoxin system HicB family antitoxin [Cellvibrio sp. pealriver]